MKNKEYYIRLGEAVERLEEKNCPTNPSKWSYYKSQAKKKFDVYPSAYANGWASKQYKDAGGGWKKCASEATDAQETEFHTQLDKLVHKTFGKRPEEMDEKFDKTHLGILQYAFKDIDRINPSEPAYKRLVDMLNKLSKQELQQIASVDIKFLSLLAKNLLSKKESVNEEMGAPVSKTKIVNVKLASGADMGTRPASALGMIGTVNIGGKKYQVKALRGSTGPIYTLIGHEKFSQNTGMPNWKYFMDKLQGLNGGKKVMFTPANDVKIGESVNESHFQVGDKVKMSHGGVGVVKSLDKEDGADDEKYYNIELPNGEVMKHAPNELTLVETDLEEGLFQDLMKGVKKGNGPFTLVVIKNNKVVKQVNVNTPQSIPANYTSLQKDYPNSRIRVEDSTGKIVFGESKSVNEGVSRDAAYIHGILQSGQDATQNFIDDNGLDGEKLSDYVKANRNNIDGYNVKHYISGERGTVGSVPKLRQAFIKKFKKGKSVNEEKVYIDFLNKKKGFKQDRIKFTSYEAAVKWAKTNFDNFNPDMIKYESVNESSMSNIDIIAQEANDFKDFVKEFYKEYKDFPKDKDTIKWLKGVYDNRSTTESIVNEATAIGKKIFSDAKGKLFFGYQNDDDTIQLVDYKTWKKLSMKDLSNEFFANRVINSIVRNQKQFNKKVEYNMWSKKTNPSFEDRMDWFIKNGWISNITKSGIKEGVESVNESSVEIGDIVFFPSANSAATVVDRFGRSVTLKLANGKKVKTVVDKIKLLAQDNVNEGNAFTGALFNARKEGLTEFEFNGKKYPVHKLEEEEKEETLAESKLTKDSLKQIIKEEYHNVKTFMEEKYGFTPELGKVYSNLAAKPFLKEEEEEILDEYDVENYQDLKEFVQFMAEYKSDINEAEYQGRKVKLGKIMQGDVKKFKVYVKNDKGNVVKVNFGQGGDAKGGTMRIRKDNPEARKSFRARHNCDNPGPRWKARYWSCRKW